MEIFTLFLIGLSLSLDAFSLSLAYGLLGIRKKKMLYSSLIVGLFHFFMPLLGSFIGIKILSSFKINPKYVIAIVIFLIILEMIKSLKEEVNTELKISFLNMLAFAFFVSLDSFTVGIGLVYVTAYPIYASIIFAIVSTILTFIGFILGKYVSGKIGKISKYIGIGILSILLIYFLF